MEGIVETFQVRFWCHDRNFLFTEDGIILNSDFRPYPGAMVEKTLLSIS